MSILIGLPAVLPEGSYEIGSFHMPFHRSVSFPKMHPLVFSKTLYGVRGPYIVVCDRKNPHWAKMTKIVKNGPKTGFLDFLRKVSH